MLKSRDLLCIRDAKVNINNHDYRYVAPNITSIMPSVGAASTWKNEQFKLL
jgi:hypothetical protein